MIGALYKRQSRSASLKKTVLGAIEHRARMVTAPGAHSNKVQEAHEDISEVDELCVKLWHEHEAEKDRIEAIRLEKAFRNARRQAVSNALVPPPTVPPLPTHLMEIHHEAVQGKLAAVTVNDSGIAISNISPHPDQNEVIEAFVGATCNPLSNPNGTLNGSVSHATLATKKARRSLASEDAWELLDDRQSKSVAAVDAFMVEIKHASDRKFYLELKKELIAKNIDQETFDQLKPVASIFYLLATCIFHRDIFSAPFTNMLNFYPMND